MFYRHTRDGRRKAIDLYDMYEGDLFLCGGHPSLKEEDLSLLTRHGVATMAMNNTATLFRPNFWVTADKPACYSKSILLDAAVMKFARLVWGREKIGEALWSEIPGTIFYGTTYEDGKSKSGEVIYRPTTLLFQKQPLAWFKNVFVIALQIAYRLGFRRVFLCGVGFKIESNQQYSYDSKLTDVQVNSNQRCYNNVVNIVKQALPHFGEFGFELISCTPDSAMNDLVPYVPFSQALNMVAHPGHDTLGVLHSSELKTPQEKSK